MIWIRNATKIKAILTLSVTMLAIFIAIGFSKECSVGIKSGIVLCVTQLVPSLFLFMILSSYISNSKVILYIGKVLQKPTQVLLKLPPACSSTIIISLIGGYPVGAKSIAALYKNKAINEQQAQKLSLIAVCSGPGFVLNFVGLTLLQSKALGTILFISQMVSYFAVMILCGRLIKSDSHVLVSKNRVKKNSLVNAVSDGCKATMNMCALVMLFCALLNVCKAVLRNCPAILDIITMLLEVTSACNSLYMKYPLWVLSFIIGFGGLCVHFQIFTMLRDIKINKGLFFLLRIMQGILASITTYILLILFNPVTEVFSTVNKTTVGNSTTLWGSVALLLTAVCFLNSLHYNKLIRR